MSFTPVVPFGGLTGWAFLKRTDTAQREAFSNSSLVSREVQYFQEKMPKALTSEQLVQDRRLLTVALGAFGLEEDINNKFFIQKIIDEGVVDPDSLANSLADQRYAEFSEAFNDLTRFSDPAAFAKDISDRYVERSFERAVGEQNNDFRLALNLERTFEQLGTRDTANDTKWFSVMGTPPLRRVFETALRLPSSIGSIPIDDQLNIFKSRAENVFGTSDLSELSGPEKQTEIVRSFLLQSEISQGFSISSGQTALALLQPATSGFR